MVLTRQSRERDFTKEGERLFQTRVLAYTVAEIKVIGNEVAYALVQVKTAALATGIKNTDEYWKLTKAGGMWSIDNIYYYNAEKHRQFINPSWPLERIVQKLVELDASYREYEVEETVEDVRGTLLERFNYYASHGRYREALGMLDLIIAGARAEHDTSLEAVATYVKGVMWYQLGDRAAANRYVMLSVNINAPAVLAFVNAASSGGGGGGQQYDTYTETRKRKVRESYGVDKMFTK
jgi:hypothetical protein